MAAAARAEAVAAVEDAVVAVAEYTDRVGIGWRGPLAAGILANLERVDIVEVMADDFVDSPTSTVRALRTLAAQVPVTIHAVSLGLASSARADAKRIDRVARVVNRVAPESWSEHLAFVRAGSIEIGHLAAPPRNAETVEGAAVNIDSAARTVGSRPFVENIATLIDPPVSDRDEATWVADVLAASGADLLLDLHNLHANATNFSFDARAFLRRIPAHRIGAIHIAGGRWVTSSEESGRERRLLDDHLHDVPDPVYELLVEVAARSPRPLTVILERDGRYPPMERLLLDLDRARQAITQGRERAAAA